jgi:hypothetical protein
MFFKKQKETPDRASSGGDSVAPRAPRYSTVARVRINGFEGEAVLRNISVGGFRMESRTYAAIVLGDRYTMQIAPDASVGIKAFELDVEVRWVRSTESSFNAGFLVVKSPLDRSLEKYIDYVTRHNPVTA